MEEDIAEHRSKLHQPVEQKISGVLTQNDKKKGQQEQTLDVEVESATKRDHTEQHRGRKEKIRKEKQVHVSNAECQEAIRSKTSKYGKLFRHHNNHWTAHTSKNFNFAQLKGIQNDLKGHEFSSKLFFNIVLEQNSKFAPSLNNPEFSHDTFSRI